MPDRLATRHELEDTRQGLSRLRLHVIRPLIIIMIPRGKCIASTLSSVRVKRPYDEQRSAGPATGHSSVFVRQHKRWLMLSNVHGLSVSWRSSLTPSRCLCFVSTSPVCISSGLFCRSGARPRPKVSSERYTLWIGTISSTLSIRLTPFNPWRWLQRSAARHVP